MVTPEELEPSWTAGLLASGSRDGTVATWDLRDGLVTQYKAHNQ